MTLIEQYANMNRNIDKLIMDNNVKKHRLVNTRCEIRSLNKNEIKELFTSRKDTLMIYCNK